MEQKKLIVVLTIVVSISGLSQGMLLPLIAYIFEREHVPSHINGLHATSLYIGVFAASLFLEGLLRTFGYRTLIVCGGLLVFLSLVLFPVFNSMTVWFILRLIVGIGDNTLHFSTQSWLTEIIPKHKLGKTMAVYGLSFSLGFMLGPLLAKLVEYHAALPFLVSAVMTLCAFLLTFNLKNSFPPSDERAISFSSTLNNFGTVIKVSWIAFIFPLIFGLLESTLNSNFPVFALKNQLTLSDITLILPAFSLGSILFQVPIGGLTDKYQRSHVMVVLTLLGGLTFISADLFIGSSWMMIMIFFLAGVFVGSLYSLGVSYMADITPSHLMPAGNLMCGMAFSAGSITGPIIGGMMIHYSGNQYYFVLVGLLILMTSAATFLFIKKTSQGIAS
ncbi:MFS transporter [Macrococcus equipercicus]|uniref:MFS transporter n=1 Tax=Macrococcus equipercicus TaxID=69967 RepID=A0ABQ6R780_9STAP|nr:MFS transporter [Macrococcus equipercicus]KAA1037718.1 MFS transporter [Macrococcus equipercicus]